jgi:hypothetical protein
LTQKGVSIFDHTSIFNELVKISDIKLLSDITGEMAQRKALVWIKTTETTLSMNQLLQRYILAVFYFSTGGEKWTHCSKQSSLCRLHNVSSNHFLSNDNECTWGGIACDSTGNVIAINIGEFILVSVTYWVVANMLIRIISNRYIYLCLIRPQRPYW